MQPIKLLIKLQLQSYKHASSTMPLLHSLRLPPPSSFPSTAAAAVAKSAAKPASLTIPKAETRIEDHLPLPLPDLPSHLKEKILSLELMGVDPSRALSLNPDLRTAPPDAINDVVSFLLFKGLLHKDLARIFGMCPRLLTSDVRSDILPVFRFLSRDLNVPDSDFRRVINKCPRRNKEALAYNDAILWVFSFENTLIHLTKIGFEYKEAVGMLLRCPAMFTFSVENNFKPKYKYLRKEMEGTLEELKAFPQYFVFSLEKRIKLRHREMAESGVRLSLLEMLKSTDEDLKELLQKCR